jgi:spore germination protein YaaH
MKSKLVVILAVWGLFPLLTAVLPQGFQQMIPGSAVYAQQAAEPATKPPEPGFWEKLQQLLQKKETSPVAQQGVTEKYDALYSWIHREEIQLYDSLSKLGVTDWDRYQNIITLRQITKDSLNQPKLASNIKTFGWHPYWMGNAYKSYRFNLLSYLAWFSYNIDPETGKCKNPDVVKKSWSDDTALVETAHKSGCKVLITITNHSDAAGHHAFLDHTERWQVLADSLKSLLKQRNGDGIDVNFENIPDDLEEEMTAFLIALKRSLLQANPKYILTVDLPIYDYRDTYQFKKLEGVVDLFLVTGYDYFNGLSRTDGPVAPLDGPSRSYNIKNSVKRYLEAGLKPEKMLVGLPYYGALWSAQSAGPGTPDSTLKFQGHLTYRALKARYCTATPNYDFDCWSAYYIVQNPDSNYYEKCWYDDSLTLSRKYDWILEQKLGGIGIWALGYDNGYPELWNLLGTKYAADTVLVYQGTQLSSKYYSLPKSLMAFRVLIAVAGIFLVVFLMAGLVIALSDWRVREIFFKNKTLRLLYIFGAAGILLSVYAFYLFVTEQSVLENHNLPGLVFGVILGVGLTYVVNYFYEKKRKELP